MLTGFDLDGVLAELDEVQITLIDLVENAQVRERLQETYFMNRKPIGLIPGVHFPSQQTQRVIITGRPLWAMPVTLMWTERHYPGTPVHFAESMLPPLLPIGLRSFRSRSRREIAEGKALQITRLGVGVFYEDDPEVIEELRRLVHIPIIPCGT